MGIILCVECDRNLAGWAVNSCCQVAPDKEVISVLDGEEALDYLHCRGDYEVSSPKKALKHPFLGLSVPFSIK